jgi:hypothetical protein
MLTYAQLPRQPKPGVTLYCPRCQDHFSAYRGDYFQCAPDDVIVCGTITSTDPEVCLEPLQLVRWKPAPLTRIRPEDAGEQEPTP